MSWDQSLLPQGLLSRFGPTAYYGIYDLSARAERVKIPHCTTCWETLPTSALPAYL